eukprot:11178576-Lingulodinium_polyedra.AAC.1
MRRASLPAARYPSVRAIEDGYQVLEHTLDPSLSAMSWAVPFDMLLEADTHWGQGPREEGGPPALRRR